MSFLKNLRGDVRSNVVGLLMLGALSIASPILATAWKAYAKENIPWTIFTVVACMGVVLIAFAIYLLKKAPPVQFPPAVSSAEEIDATRSKTVLRANGTEAGRDNRDALRSSFQFVPSDVGRVVIEAITFLESTPRLHPLNAILKAGAANLASNEDVVEVNRQIAGRNYGAPFSEAVQEKDYLKFLQFSVNQRLPLGIDTEIYEATKQFYSRQTESVENPQLTALRDKLDMLLKKKERIKDTPDSPGFDMGQVRRRNQLQINEVREEIKRLESERQPSLAENDQSPPRREVIRHEAFEKRQAEEGIAIHLPRANEVKRPIHFYYDQLEALIQTGSEMLESLRSNTAPVPAKGEVDEWARQLDDVVTCCATVAERQALRNSRIGVAFEDAFLDIAAVAPGEHYDTITEIFSKLTVAKGIAARLHKEDRG